MNLNSSPRSARESCYVVIGSSAAAQEKAADHPHGHRGAKGR